MSRSPIHSPSASPAAPPSSPSPSISSTTLPHTPLRLAATLSLLPALPLCVTHGALSNSLVPALGLLPLSVSAAASLFLLVRGRSLEKEKGKSGERGGLLGPEEEEEGEGRFRRRLGAEVEEERREGEEEEEERDGGSERQSVLTHRILVFVVDVGLAAALMVVLVFTWIQTRRTNRPELAMLAAYATVPLLGNFLIHLYLAARELVAGLAIPQLVEWSAWRAVPPDCPHCGSRLRPDALPPIPWYESVSAPKVSLPRVKRPPIGRPSIPGFMVPRFSFKDPREWKVPNWMRGRSQDYASLFVDDEQNERDRYRDDPEGGFAGPSSNTTVIATGSVVPVEEVVVGKKDKKKTASGAGLFAEDEPSWS